MVSPILAMIAACAIPPADLPAPAALFVALAAVESGGAENAANIGEGRRDFPSAAAAAEAVEKARADKKPVRIGLFGVPGRFVDRPVTAADFERCGNLKLAVEAVAKTRPKCRGKADGDALFCLAGWLGSDEGEQPNTPYADKIAQQMLLAEVPPGGDPTGLFVPLHVPVIAGEDQLFIPLGAAEKAAETGLFPDRGVPDELRDEAKKSPQKEP